MYTQTNAWTGKNWTTAVHKGGLAFMVPELIFEELPIASTWTDKLKTVDVWVSMAFFTILKPDQPYPFQHDLKNIPNKITSNIKQLISSSYRSKLILPLV